MLPSTAPFEVPPAAMALRVMDGVRKSLILRQSASTTDAIGRLYLNSQCGWHRVSATAWLPAYPTF